MKAKGTYEFEIKFRAKSAIHYEFQLPCSIKNYG